MITPGKLTVPRLVIGQSYQVRGKKDQRWRMKVLRKLAGPGDRYLCMHFTGDRDELVVHNADGSSESSACYNTTEFDYYLKKLTLRR